VPTAYGKKRVAPDRRTRLGRRDAALLAVLRGTGMLIGEARQLRLSDVESRDGTLHFTVQKLKVRTRMQPRTIPLFWPEAHLPNIRSYIAERRRNLTDHDYLFPGRKARPLSVMECQRIVNRYTDGPRAVRAEFIKAAESVLTLDELCAQLGIHPPRRTARGWPFRATRALQTAISDRAPSPELRAVVLLRDGHRCCACGEHLAKGQAEIDHIDPRGPTELTNLQVLCQPCNVWKADYYIIDFRALWEWLESRRDSEGSDVVRPNV